MTDFHKLFMVKMNKMIKKKTGGIFLVVYEFMVALCIQIAKNIVLFTGFIPRNYATFKR